METGSDNELMLRVQEGRTGDLGVLFERHHARLLNYFLRMTGSRPASEDLVQEVFVRMLRYRDSYRGKGGGFTTWMYSLARHACIDYLRRSAMRNHAPLPVEEPADHGRAVDETVETRDSIRVLQRALLQLAPEKREVLILRRWDFRKFDEIAKILNCPVGTVKVRAHRALRELKQIYQGLLGEAST